MAKLLGFSLSMSHNDVTEEDKKVAKTAGLIQRKQRWYFNKAYPKDVWHLSGTSPFRKSLGTTSRDDAMRLRLDAEKLYWSKVDGFRAQLPTNQQARGLTEIEAMGLVASWLREEDAERTAELEASRGTTLDIDATLQKLNDEEAAAREDIAEREFAAVKPLATRLAEEAGLEFDVRSKEFRTFMAALLRGRRELLALQRGRLLGDYTVTPQDPMVRQILATGSEPDKVLHTLEELIEGYLADNQPRWAPSTAKAASAPLRALKELLGTSRDVSTITREDGRALFNDIRSLPRNFAKLPELKGLSMKAAIEKGKKLGLPTLAPASVNEIYLNFIGGALRWGVKEQWLASDPLSGLSVIDTVADEDKREPFTPAQLNRLFRSSRWEASFDLTASGDPLRFWGPLIALYQGMRRGEIAQLRVEDVEKVDGVLVFQVRPSADGQRVKSTAGRRTLPVHAELIRMGLPEFVAAQRTAGHKQLFPAQRPNRNGAWGDGMGKWFSRIVGEFKGVKLGMHSFRHNFEDALRAAGYHGTAIGQELAGREKTDKVSGSYGAGRYPVASLKEAMDKIAYPEVDLRHLHKVS